jgi:hypothetical protein
MSGNGIAVLEEGDTFGGGAFTDYAINSNTSADGFLKCVIRKKEPPIKIA